MTQVFVWTVGDVLQLAVLVLGVMFFGLKHTVAQALCKHDGSIGETQACDAICHKCGKNLGFIGGWNRSRSRSRANG
jgi:hypothetical protein